jgi:hypothetical protein
MRPFAQRGVDGDHDSCHRQRREHEKDARSVGTGFAGWDLKPDAKPVDVDVCTAAWGG